MLHQCYLIHCLPLRMVFMQKRGEYIGILLAISTQSFLVIPSPSQGHSRQFTQSNEFTSTRFPNPSNSLSLSLHRPWFVQVSLSSSVFSPPTPLYNLLLPPHFHTSIPPNSLSLSLSTFSLLKNPEKRGEERQQPPQQPPNFFGTAMESPVSMRRPCCFAEDDGLASVAEMEAGFSGYCNNSNSNNVNYSYYMQNTQQIMMRRRNSLRSISSIAGSCVSSCSGAVNSPRSGRVLDARFVVEEPHFLEACFMCKKPLGGNRDIFMYRGDTPFCSEECRQEQIEIDEAKEKNRKMKILRSKKEKAKSAANASASSSSSSSSPSKSQNYPFRTGTVVAA